MFAALLASSALVALIAVPADLMLAPAHPHISLPPSASPAPSAAESERQIRDNLEYFEVPVAQWDGILAKFRSGEPLDAFTNETPVRVEQLQRDGSVWNIERFADGSYDATTMEADVAVGHADAVGALGVDGCTTYNSAGVVSYQNCKAQKNMVYLDMKFWVDFSRWSGGSSISNARDWDVQVVGASYTLQEFGVTQAHGYSDSNPAKARLKVSASILGGLGGGTPWIEVRVSPGNYSLEANW